MFNFQTAKKEKSVEEEEDEVMESEADAEEEDDVKPRASSSKSKNGKVSGYYSWILTGHRASGRSCELAKLTNILLASRLANPNPAPRQKPTTKSNSSNTMTM